MINILKLMIINIFIKILKQSKLLRSFDHLKNKYRFAIFGLSLGCFNSTKNKPKNKNQINLIFSLIWLIVNKY